MFLGAGALLALPLSAATNVLVGAGALRDAAGNPLPPGALVILAASTTDATFSAPTPGTILSPGAVIANDDVVIATWAVDSTVTGLAGGSYRLVAFDYGRMAIPNFGAGDKLVLYWFPGATLVNPVVAPGTSYGSYRTDEISARSNMSWIAPADTNGATLALSVLTLGAGGEVAITAATASGTVGSGSGVPNIVQQPATQAVAVGANATLSVVVTGTPPLTYQWFKGGQSIAGATTSSLVLVSARLTDAGTYTVTISNAAGTVTSSGAVLNVISPTDVARGQLAGTSRGFAGSGVMLLSGAFTVEGASAKQMLIRAVGPGLGAFNVSGVMADPQVEIVHATTGALVATNDDWGTGGNAAQLPAISAQVGAFALGVGSKDAAILASFQPGTYRVRVMGANGGTGVAQLEIFDADAVPRLVFLAARAYAGAGGTALVQGLAIAAPPSGRSYLVRALGPALGIPGALADPQLAVYSSTNGTVPVAGNDDWGGDASLASLAASVGAMALPPASQDAALNFAPQAAGTYTLQVSGVAGATGLALLEIFEADAQRAAQLPAAIVSPPESVAVAVGQAATMAVVVVGKPAPTFQWRKNSIAISGATNARYALTSAQLGDAGSYDVVVANSGGSATSPVVTLSVAANAEHSADTDRNSRLSLVELTRVIELYNTRISTTRTGCYLVATTTTEDGFIADQTRLGSTTVTLSKYHSADSNRDGRISLLELTRIIELYNYRSGTTRTGQYHVQAGTEDGFASGP